jgi:glycosyltransferase involved in cell wall biosynthesis
VKTISIITPCYNEEQNVREVYARVRDAIASLGNYRYEHIFIDNASTDNTLGVLKVIAAMDRNVKVIRNTRNFGHVRSPMHAFHQATGDVVIGIVADLQDPPEMIVDMVRHWEAGTPVVIGVKFASDESSLMFWIRKRYYRLVNRLSGIETYENFTGFGLYDRKVVDIIKSLDDPYPYFRGIIAELGFPRVELPYHQPMRKRGITANNLYSLYDIAMLGITNLSKVPLRLAVFLGFGGAVVSVLTSFAYLAYKLLFWRNFELGVAPILIGFFFLASIHLLFLGMIGEYVGAIHTMVQKRPFAIEQERINFEFGPGEPVKSNEEKNAGRA